jgi:guanylate kinase
MSGKAMKQQGLLLVLSGPSGVGKTTIVHELRKRYDSTFSVSATTRAPREGEVHGRDYWFVSRPDFQRMIEQDELLEHALVFNRDHYGTPRKPVLEAIAQGRLAILDIDVQGGLQVRRSMPEALMVFILPPDDATLLRRLRERGTDRDEVIERRVAEARREIATARDSGVYDAFIVNDQHDLNRTIVELVRIINDRWSTDRCARPERPCV